MVESGWIPIEQYSAAFEGRVHEGRIENTELYVIYFRIISSNLAVKDLVRVNSNTLPTPAGLALELTFLDADMQDKFRSKGDMFDGVWNTSPSLHVGTPQNPREFICADGFLQKADGFQVPKEWLNEAVDLSNLQVLDVSAR